METIKIHHLILSMPSPNTQKQNHGGTIALPALRWSPAPSSQWENRGQVSQLLEAKPKPLVALGCRVTSLTPKTLLSPLRLYHGGPGLSLPFPSTWPPGSYKIQANTL